ncbi:MAG: formate dehydrogenase [Firmicutes bacterium]|nr:formate dehydrogenase [Bacillota bacterium]
MSEPKTILRFTKTERFTHWVHGFSFVLLLFTGLGVLSMSFRPAMDIFGGIEVTRNIHRVVAVIFGVSIIAVLLIKSGRPVREWIRDCFKFTLDDYKHAINFPIEFFGGHKPFPPQGKFNGGEKINSLITIFGTVCIGISGILIWIGSSTLPVWVIQWAYPIHAGFALLMTALLIAHMYLGLLHPDSNQAFKGMINGYVPAKFAREHYEKWFDKQNISG